MTDSEAVTLVSIIPELHAGTGHVLGYHLSVGDAARIAGWRHVALVPKEHGIGKLPPDWIPILEPGELNRGLPHAIQRGRVLQLLADVGRFAESIREGILAAARTHPSELVLLMERFTGPELLASARAVHPLARERLHFWLMFRHDLASTGLMGHAYAWVASRLARQFGPRFKLLADAESLARQLERSLGLTAHVMPIPHTRARTYAPFAKEPGEIVAWWAGPPRVEKGLATIRALARLGSTRWPGRVRLVVSEEAQLDEGGAVRVERVPSRLSAEDYGRWFATTDVVLLPYDPQRYRHSTSGIFAECVVAGCVPLVSRGTWMAGELARDDLTQLAVDWNDPQALLGTIVSTREDAAMRERLGRLRRRFAEFHCEASYALRMQKLLSGEP